MKTIIDSIKNKFIPKNESIKRGDEWVNEANGLHKVITKIKKLEASKVELVKKLRSMSKERNSCGGGFEFKKIEKVGAVRYSLIPELKEMDLNRYRGNPISYWKLNKKF